MTDQGGAEDDILPPGGDDVDETFLIACRLPTVQFGEFHPIAVEGYAQFLEFQFRPADSGDFGVRVRAVRYDQPTGAGRGREECVLDNDSRMAVRVVGQLEP